MSKKFQLSIAALALLVMTASGSREESVSGLPEATATAATATPAAQGTIVFTFTGDEVLFGAMAKGITVDWGDGKTNKYDEDDLDFLVSHSYVGNAAHTVRIQAENLSEFNCPDNGITALDVSNCTALTELWCGDNQLSALDVSKNTALTTLVCSDNNLSALDVSKNKALTELYCFENQLSAALNRIFTDLPDRSGMEEGYISIEYNPGTDTCNRSIVTKKNWDVNDY